MTIPLKVAGVVILTRGLPFVIRVPVLVAVSEIWLDSTVKIEKKMSLLIAKIIDTYF